MQHGPVGKILDTVNRISEGFGATCEKKKTWSDFCFKLLVFDTFHLGSLLFLLLLSGYL